ncbi:MAG: hypothetical protein IT372_39695 [Polyangiaceae bacterium]|nr:hypothetical protein [Polyangiaceae bacterium]
MTSTPRASSPSARLAAPLAAVALALALASAGCGKVGCFRWTEAEGECPSQDAAAEYFGSNQCGGSIESVDSEGELDGAYCCYDVTERDDGDYYDCAVPAE